MAAPTSTHVAKYHAGNVPAAADGRLFSDVFLRNSPPLIAALAPLLAGRCGTVLEIGAGTGQHAGACALAFPSLTWQASDPDATHRASVSAWAAHLRLASPPPIALDAASDWATLPEITGIAPLTAVVAMNVIHIAPFAVAEGIVAGAGKSLAQGGLLIFYGPFKVHGAHIGDGNAGFDAGLRADNTEWGLRDVAEIEALARPAGLEFAALQAMPANNRLFVLRKT
ncbi:MAG: class I SAM-dependent methyltransferase [Rhodobacter sp.]|nr:class I SAM-dependent methyltransferase [Rhodobacter sp.]